MGTADESFMPASTIVRWARSTTPSASTGLATPSRIMRRSPRGFGAKECAEAGLFVVMILREGLSQTKIGHDYERKAIGDRLVVLGTLAIQL